MLLLGCMKTDQYKLEVAARSVVDITPDSSFLIYGIGSVQIINFRIRRVAYYLVTFIICKLTEQQKIAK